MITNIKSGLVVGRDISWALSDEQVFGPENLTHFAFFVDHCGRNPVIPRTTIVQDILPLENLPTQGFGYYFCKVVGQKLYFGLACLPAPQMPSQDEEFTHRIITAFNALPVSSRQDIGFVFMRDWRDRYNDIVIYTTLARCVKRVFIYYCIPDYC